MKQPQSYTATFMTKALLGMLGLGTVTVVSSKIEKTMNHVFSVFFIAIFLSFIFASTL